MFLIVGACTDSSCLNGKCVEGRCQCDPGFLGPTCTAPCDNSVTCHDHGICNKYCSITPFIHRDNSCDCIVGYYGSSCTEECTDDIQCNQHGHCTKYGSCLCDEGYDGFNCEIHDSSYSFLIIVLIGVNLVIAFLWYRQRVSGIPMIFTIRIQLYLSENCHTDFIVLSLEHLSSTQKPWQLVVSVNWSSHSHSHMPPVHCQVLRQQLINLRISGSVQLVLSRILLQRNSVLYAQLRRDRLLMSK